MKIYRINLTHLTAVTEEVPPEWRALGGRALSSAIVAKEVDPLCHPLGANNKLILAPGLLSATTAPNSGRLSVGAKSPLTGGIKESNAGGSAAQKLTRLGIKAVIIEGKPPGKAFYCIHINSQGVIITEEKELVGKGNYEVVHRVSEKYGADVGVLTIGQAGEYRMTAANISVKDPDGNLRSAGRGGMGAVMGSKQIKYIAIDDSHSSGPELVNGEKFRAAAKAFAQALTEHAVTGQGLPQYGTDILINIMNEAGGLPTQNFRRGNFFGADKISGETLYDTILARKGKPTHACHLGCMIRCSQVYNDPEGNYVTSGFEYETIWGFGAGCLIDDLDIIAQADRICDDIGLDSIEAAVTVGVAMEGGVIPFGDGQGLLNLLSEVQKGSYLGRILGNGAAFTGRALGVTRVPVVKGQGIPAYDPRVVKGQGLTFATSPMGADHTAGYAVTANILKVGGYVDPLQKQGQVELSRNLQIATAAIDSAGLCLFVAFAVLDIPAAFDAIVDMLNAQYGLSLTGDDISELGKTVLRTERAFNRAAGFTNKDDRLPEFFKEKCPPHNATWDFTDEEIDQVFDF
ncbi:aldehyde ferredoxin oxidoreductase [Acididesulfobacillus acetoxydans]|uniref:Aldehyde ferredoxin oxidoreductase n=1 Tax=Acididesulfobacillus acetoxydans TaxID=1561005 RepID=A0A8S0WN67_9FIRM|nr:aldehyde ferredoxin oxidoreductase C-terminal domain-containing protein [Acididesulfobacillus acetoxydans]CAA7601084.1 aldehyde ferredoxin oxidoreductase [Acididesulfobacillus acetoxydans]CEJ06958.1 Tungsten-containing aldehyde ferredoxin oxidoreductase [Acididesulfobacillus acetoxydans]